MDGGAWQATVHGVTKSWTQLSDFTFTFHFHALEQEMATHSSVLAWRIPGTEEPGGLPSIHTESDTTEATQQQQQGCVSSKGSKEKSFLVFSQLLVIASSPWHFLTHTCISPVSASVAVSSMCIRSESSGFPCVHVSLSFSFSIEVQLIYNVMLVSGVQ